MRLQLAFLLYIAAYVAPGKSELTEHAAGGLVMQRDEGYIPDYDATVPDLQTHNPQSTEADASEPIAIAPATEEITEGEEVSEITHLRSAAAAADADAAELAAEAAAEAAELAAEAAAMLNTVIETPHLRATAQSVVDSESGSEELRTLLADRASDNTDTPETTSSDDTQPAEQAAPVEPIVPAEEPAPAGTQPTEQAAPVEPIVPAEEPAAADTQPTEQAAPVEPIVPAEEPAAADTQPAEQAAPVEPVVPAEEPAPADTQPAEQAQSSRKQAVVEKAKPDEKVAPVKAKRARGKPVEKAKPKAKPAEIVKPVENVKPIKAKSIKAKPTEKVTPIEHVKAAEKAKIAAAEKEKAAEKAKAAENAKLSEKTKAAEVAKAAAQAKVAQKAAPTAASKQAAPQPEMVAVEVGADGEIGPASTVQMSENHRLVKAVHSGDADSMMNTVKELEKRAAADKGLSLTAMVSAVRSGNVETVKLLLYRTKLPINAAGATGNTALMWAALWGKDEIVQYLLSEGADRSLKNKAGKTADRLALEGGHRTLSSKIREFKLKKK